MPVHGAQLDKHLCHLITGPTYACHLQPVGKYEHAGIVSEVSLSQRLHSISLFARQGPICGDDQRFAWRQSKSLKSVHDMLLVVGSVGAATHQLGQSCPDTHRTPQIKKPLARERQRQPGAW